MAEFASDMRLTADGKGLEHHQIEVEGETLDEILESAKAKLASLGFAEAEIIPVSKHDLAEALFVTHGMLEFAVDLEEDLHRYDTAADGTSVSADRAHVCDQPHARLSSKEMTGVAYGIVARRALQDAGIGPETSPDDVPPAEHMQVALRTFAYHRLIQGNPDEIGPLLRGFTEFGYRLALRDVATGKVIPGTPPSFAPGEQLDEGGHDLPDPVDDDHPDAAGTGPRE